MTGPDRRTIKIDVVVDSDTRGSDKAAASLEQVDKSAGKAEHGLADLEKQSKNLDVQLERSRRAVKDLESELIRTEDRATGRGSLRGRLNQERSWLRELERLSKSTAESVAATGSTLGAQAAKSAETSLKGPLIGAAVALVAAAAPAIGAIVAGAVAGTVAGGGIAGGVIAASTDVRVRGAFKDLVGELSAEAFGGGAFVEPAVKGIYSLRDAFKDLHIDEALAKGASSVPILAGGIGDLVKNIMPGFNAVMDKAEDFTKVFAEGLGDTGSAISDFLESIVSSEGTIEGLHAGFKLLNGTIIATGHILEGLADVFHASLVAGKAFTGVVADTAHWIQVIGSLGLVRNGSAIEHAFRFMHDQLADMEGVGYGAAGAVAAVDKVIRETKSDTEGATENWKKFNDEFERNISLQGDFLLSQLDVNEGLLQLEDTFAQNGAVLNDNTQAGIENERALIEMAEKMRAAYEKQIELTGATKEASDTLEANHQKLLDQAEAAGISRQAVEDLIGALFRIPKVNFMGSAVTFGQSNSTFGGGLQEFAEGGIVKGPYPGAPVLIKAHAGEEVRTKAQQYARAMGGSGGSSATPLVLNSSGLDGLVFEWLRTQIAAKGGTLAVLGLRNN